MGVRYGAPWRRLRALVLAEEGYRCRLCGDRATEVDHVVALVVWPEGELVRSNCQAICRQCNVAKELERRAAAARVRPGVAGRRAW